MNTPYGTVVNHVRALCARPSGASLREIADEIGRPMNTASVYVVKMEHAKEVVKVGAHGAYRYFKDHELAAIFDVQAKDEHKARLAESKRKKNERRAQRAREKCAADRAAKGLPPFVHGKKPAKPKKVSIERRSSGLVIGSKEPSTTRQNVTATVIWPKSVLVQGIPTGRDTRFTFDPPPGWKGQITRDWMDRRLQSAGMR